MADGSSFTVLAELHCHTRFSDGWSSAITCVRRAARQGLRLLAITDHNTAEGAVQFWEEPVQEDVLVIPGEEISTDAGHVLAFFVRATIPPGSFETVIRAIRDQGALAYMAHPYHIPLGNRWRKLPLCHGHLDQVRLLDGIEVENGHNRSSANALAAGLASSERLPAISGSDAHFLFEIGNACTELEISELTMDAVRSALLGNRAIVRPRRFNAYPIYLWAGLANRLRGQRYSIREAEVHGNR